MEEEEEVAVEETGKKKRGKKKFLVLLLLPLIGGGLFFSGILGGGKKADAKAEEKKEVKEETVVLGTVALEPITLNLADGRYLQVGLGLEIVEVEGLEHSAAGAAGGHGAAFDAELWKGGPTAKALDLTIHTMSNYSYEELSAAEGREKAKHELEEEIKHAYHGEIHKVYFTEFVMQ